MMRTHNPSEEGTSSIARYITYSRALDALFLPATAAVVTHSKHHQLERNLAIYNYLNAWSCWRWSWHTKIAHWERSQLITGALYDCISRIEHQCDSPKCYLSKSPIQNECLHSIAPLGPATVLGMVGMVPIELGLLTLLSPSQHSVHRCSIQTHSSYRSRKSTTQMSVVENKGQSRGPGVQSRVLASRPSSHHREWTGSEQQRSEHFGHFLHGPSYHPIGKQGHDQNLAQSTTSLRRSIARSRQKVHFSKVYFDLSIHWFCPF